MLPKGVIAIILIIVSVVVITLSTNPTIFQSLQFLQTQTQTEVTPTLTPAPTSTPTPTPTSSPNAAPKKVATPSATPTKTPTPTPIVQNNTPPGSGYSVQNVGVDGQTFKVAIIAADLNSTKVIIDTASDSDCRDNCPVLSLGEYVSKNGAWAGINGSYFCPAEYPSCAGKIGSFDTLVMNKNKTYFNSDNNVYSTVPAAIFSSSARFVGQTSEWGRDTGVDGVIANYPLLVRGGSINFTEAPNEPKFGGAASRTFVANQQAGTSGSKGNMVYIGIVYGATMGQSAKVLHAMGMDNALNLDQGGSTALWHGGYKAGPGRNIPNAILFVNR